MYFPFIRKLSLCLFFLASPFGCAGDSYEGENNAPIRNEPPLTNSDSDASISPFDIARRWSNQLALYGERFCNPDEIREHQLWEGSVWYYDGARVYYNAADFFQDQKWESCAQFVLNTYKTYVIDSDGNIPGWRVFPHGLYEHFLRTGDRTSRQAILLLAERSAFAKTSGGADAELSRETAYLIHTFLIARQLGLQSFDGQLEIAIAHAREHLRQWTRLQGAEYAKPFMMGLTFEALISAYETKSDSRSLTTLQEAADWLWENGWNPTRGSFPYLICKSNSSYSECKEQPIPFAPDLNLLIAPAYAWLYIVTGEPKYAEMADRIFIGGVTQADLSSGKRFSQNFRWSNDYMRWRLGIESRNGLS